MEKWICHFSFQSGNVNMVNNYRPITILSNFAKIFESAIDRRISNRVFSPLNSAQHGFVRRRSTCTNLICVFQFIADTLNASGQVAFEKSVYRLLKGF